VEWAVATRLRPDKGLTVIPDTRGSSLDPSSEKSGLVSKWLIDATIPIDSQREKFTRVDESDTYPEG
jgi:3-polyprenyl-4-hydroxybenzoate decarboxylase